MMLEDEDGFFVVLLKSKQISQYMYVLGGKRIGKEVFASYAFPPRIITRVESKLQDVVCYRFYEKNMRLLDEN